MTTQIKLDEAIAVTIDSLRAHQGRLVPGRAPAPWRASDVSRSLAQLTARSMPGVDREHLSWELLPLAIEAAWELVRRGILRPGFPSYPSTGYSGEEFVLTQAGRTWIDASDSDRVIMLQPGSLSRTLSEYRSLYGDGYLQRSTEALKCRSSGAYLACCAMCGAAAESIILALAITKSGDADEILKVYNSRSGRSSVLRLLIGQVVDPVRRRMTTYAELLSYWRDDAAHGVASTIGDAHAEEALERLLRFAQFSSDHWTELTGKPRS